MAARLFPVMFVLLWATGFIGAGLSMPYAEPFTFMAVRFSIAAVIMTLWALASRSIWPKGDVLLHAAIAGCLIHGVYLPPCSGPFTTACLRECQVWWRAFSRC